jgi:hypothetical protein
MNVNQEKAEEIFESNGGDFTTNNESNNAQLLNIKQKLLFDDKDKTQNIPQSIPENSFLNTQNNINPEDAFQVFNGRLFAVPQKNDYFSLADMNERKVESPLQRYSRFYSFIFFLFLNSLG